MANIDFELLMSDMQDLIMEQGQDFEGVEQNTMCEYDMKYVSIDHTFTCYFSFDQRKDLPNDIIDMDAFDELISNITIADIEMDESDTKDRNGDLQHPGCLKVKFTFEDEQVLIVDGIAYENQDDEGTLFTEYVMPAVIDYIKMGTMKLCKVTEYED